MIWMKLYLWINDFIEYPQEALDELNIDKQEEIESLFGSTQNYERFKTECFE